MFGRRRKSSKVTSTASTTPTKTPTPMPVNNEKKVSMFTVDRKSKMKNGKCLFIFNPAAIYTQPTITPIHAKSTKPSRKISDTTEMGGKDEPPSPSQTPVMKNTMSELFELHLPSDLSDPISASPSPRLPHQYTAKPRRHSICGDSPSLLPLGMKRQSSHGNSPPMINKRVSVPTTPQLLTLDGELLFVPDEDAIVTRCRGMSAPADLSLSDFIRFQEGTDENLASISEEFDPLDFLDLDSPQLRYTSRPL
jgi:hypothetical protein